MTDPLSVAGTIVGIVSLGLSVSKGLKTFIEAVRDAPEDLKAVQNDLSALCDALDQVKEVLELPGARLSEKSLSSALSNCDEDFRDINVKLESASVYIREKQQQQQQGIRIARLAKVTLSRNEHMRWFYKQGSIEKLRANFLHSKLTLLLAVNVAELYRVEKERRAEMKSESKASRSIDPNDSTGADTSRELPGVIDDSTDGDDTMVSLMYSTKSGGSDTTEKPADTQQPDGPNMQSATEPSDIADSLNTKSGLDVNPQQTELERAQLVDTIWSLRKQVDQLEKQTPKKRKGGSKQKRAVFEATKSDSVNADQDPFAETPWKSGHQKTPHTSSPRRSSNESEKSSAGDETLKLWMMNANTLWNPEELSNLMSIQQAKIPQEEIQNYLKTQMARKPEGVLIMLRRLNSGQRDSICAHCRDNEGEIRLVEEWEKTRIPGNFGSIEVVNLAWITAHDPQEEEAESQSASSYSPAPPPSRAVRGGLFGDNAPPPSSLPQTTSGFLGPRGAPREPPYRSSAFGRATQAQPALWPAPPLSRPPPPPPLSGPPPPPLASGPAPPPPLPRRKKAGIVSEESDSDRSNSSEESGEESDDELNPDAAEEVVADLMSKWIDEDDEDDEVF